MMRVQQIALRRNTIRARIPDGYRFVPAGRFVWAQKLAWHFLEWAGVLEPDFDMTETYETICIDTQSFVERLYQQQRSVFELLGEKPRRLLIGSKDYADMMNSPEVAQNLSYFSFSGQADIYRNGVPAVMGLAVTVVPWMTGMVVIP